MEAVDIAGPSPTLQKLESGRGKTRVSPPKLDPFYKYIRAKGPRIISHSLQEIPLLALAGKPLKGPMKTRTSPAVMRLTPLCSTSGSVAAAQTAQANKLSQLAVTENSASFAGALLSGRAGASRGDEDR